MPAPTEVTRQRFSDWMSQALYNPLNGYYTRHIRELGRRGDFTTSPAQADDLAQAIARWTRHEQEYHGNPQPHLIEIGPGDGSLAAAVLRRLDRDRRRRPRAWFAPRWRLHLVDVESPLREQQHARLKPFGQRVQWHATPAEALQAAGGRALMWSNELIDALPATVLRWRSESSSDPAGGQWQELWIETDAEGLRENWQSFDPSTLTLPSSALDPAAWPGGSPPQGQRIELHDRVIPWLADWLPHWHGGSLLTIDYGDEFPALYHRRPRGTLRAYSHHQRLEGREIYHRMGRQDLTADVNFTDLRTWTESMGLQTVSLETQAEFIRHLAPTGPLTAPAPHNQAFQVLWQRRSVPLRES